jgi:hypothetical protein
VAAAPFVFWRSVIWPSLHFILGEHEPDFTVSGGLVVAPRWSSAITRALAAAFATRQGCCFQAARSVALRQKRCAVARKQPAISSLENARRGTKSAWALLTKNRIWSPIHSID